VARTCWSADPAVSFPVLQEAELWSGKVKALTERTATRDLYDLYRLARQTPGFLVDDLARALTLRAVSASDSFPRLLHPAAALAKFSARPELVEPLYDMLAADDRPNLEVMTSAVARLFEPLVSLSDREQEYLRLLSDESSYRPELLFGAWPDVLGRAVIDPVMQWKVLNLRRRARGG